MKADKQIYDSVIEYLKESEFIITGEKEEEFCNRIDVKTGIFKCNVNIYNSGKIVVGGTDSPLKEVLSKMKMEIEGGNFSPAKALPFEIERFPALIRERIPNCDPVITCFIEEAMGALRADLLLSAAFLIGAASEKAIYMLVDTYGNCIKDEKNRNAFLERAGKNKIISKKFDDFMQSYKSCKTHPTDPKLLGDSYTILTSLFTFYRLTRNEVGHPEIVPNLDKGIIIANIAQFICYLETVYGLTDFFCNNPVEL